MALPTMSVFISRVPSLRMLGNVTATQCLMLRLGQLQTQGLMTDEHASLAKAFCTVKCRETVGYARELLGGNGILLENLYRGRFVADAEAIYSSPRGLERAGSPRSACQIACAGSRNGGRAQ